MRKFLAVLTSIVTTGAILLTIAVFLLSAFIHGEFMNQMVDSIYEENISSNITTSNVLYAEAEKAGISKETLDEILSQEEIKTYISGVAQEVIESNLNQETELNEERIKDLTREFYQEIEEKYHLNLSQAEQETLEEVTSSLVQEELEPVVQNTDPEINGVMEFLQACTNPLTYSILLAISIIGIFVIFVLALKEKRFFHYYGYMALFLTILLAGLSAFIHFLSYVLAEDPSISISGLFAPLYQKGYVATVISLVLCIVFFLFHHLIQHRTELKEKVPF